MRALRQLRVGPLVGASGRRPVRGRHAVSHGTWGVGVVQRYEDDAVVVLFDDAGCKTLAVDVVVSRGLLTPG